jgi:hypothetical protein
MARKDTPPKSGGHKLPVAYTARLGTLKTCPSCGEEKEVTFSNWAPKKDNQDGISEICRKCQGKSSGGKREAKAAFPRRSQWPDPGKDKKAYWDWVKERTAQLYELANDPKRDAEFNEVVLDLNKVTRCQDDPAGGGEQKDPELAFRTFCHVLSRLVTGWTGFAPIHDDIINALMDPSGQILLLASRNSGKSSITQMYAAWLIHRNPLEIVVVLSSGSGLAKRNLKAVRDFIGGCPLLRSLAPSDECLDSAHQFVTPQANGRIGASTSFSAFGITSKITGLRAGVIIFDDVESKGDDTPAAQESLDSLTAEAHHLLNPGGRIIALGTPQVLGMSIYGRWARSGEWTLHRAKLFDEAHDGGTNPTLSSRWPQRWPDSELEKKRRGMPEREWNLHWRIDLSTEATDDKPLKLRNFITVNHSPFAATFPTIIKPGGERLVHLETGVADADDFFRGPVMVSSENSRYLLTVAAVDPASGTQGNDEVGIAVVSVTGQGKAVIRGIAGMRGTTAQDTLQKTAAYIHCFYPSKVVCEAREDSMYPAQLTSVLARRGFSIIVDKVHSGARKGVRILDAVGVPLSDDRLVLLEAVVTGNDAQETIKQITHMTADARELRHDDRVDALAWALVTIAPMIQGDEAETLPSASRTEYERLASLPFRKGGFASDLYEAMADFNEDEERLRMKLNNALTRQEQELRDGHVDPHLSLYIQQLQKDVRNMGGMRYD